MASNPYITQLPGPGRSTRLDMQPFDPGRRSAPIPGLNKTGPTTTPRQQDQSHFRDARNDWQAFRDDFREMDRGPEKRALRPQFDMQREYVQDTRDWWRGRPDRGQPPQMPLQMTPTYQGFPGTFPGSAPPVNPNLSPQQRALQHLNGLNLPPQVLERLMATLSGKGQTVQPPHDSDPDTNIAPWKRTAPTTGDRDPNFNDPTFRGR